MRSFSSGVGGSVLAPQKVGFATWTPDAIPSAARSHSAELPEGTIDEAVNAAVQRTGEEARQREAALIEAHAAECDRIALDAYERGYEEGRCAGEIGEAARLRTALLVAEEALDEVREGEVRWTGTIEENVCALAVSIARQIIGRELKGDVGPVFDLVRHALSDFPIDQPIRIRINPGDLSTMQSVAGTPQDRFVAIAADRDARWIPDPSIAPGGCVVEGRERIVDGRIDTALERVYRRLTYTHA
jgi:flagellar assembly protein FliH